MNMNWKYILIVLILATISGSWTLWFSELLEIPEKEKPPNIVKLQEMVGGVLITQNLNRDLILEKIQAGRDFLFRMADEEEKGFHKYYYAKTDELEDRLHTVYSASIIYTFLYINDLEKDEEILNNLADWGSFLLFMQNQDKEDKSYGAFHYSYFLRTREKEKKFVVGTAALTIFTLLRLYEVTQEEKYLDSAKLAGDWLTTMQKTDGSMKPYFKYSDNRWISGSKESLLYNGQVLSALSKLYGATDEEKYLQTAQGIAQRFSQKYEEEQGFIEGEYREKNPISNAWVVMSLMDFYKVNLDDYYKEIVFSLADEVVDKQKTDPTDPLQHGSWWKVYSTSGVGWISEVMTETYRFCQKQNRADCEKYKNSALKAIRLLVQNTYPAQNSSHLKNPDKANGGVFWNAETPHVRTDSVCHALNGYVRIMDYLGDGLLLSIPKENI